MKSASATRHLTFGKGPARRPLRERNQTPEGPGGGKCRAEEDVRQPLAGRRCAQGRHRKKALSSSEQRRLVTHISQEHSVSIRQGYQVVGLFRYVLRAKPKPKQDEAVIDEVNELGAKPPAIDFWRANLPDAKHSGRLQLAGASD